MPSDFTGTIAGNRHYRGTGPLLLVLGQVMPAVKQGLYVLVVHQWPLHFDFHCNYLLFFNTLMRMVIMAMIDDGAADDDDMMMV